MSENKASKFLVTAVLFIVYTIGVVYTTLEIGYDVLGIGPNWQAVALSFALMLATMLPVYMIIYLAVIEYFRQRAVVIDLPILSDNLKSDQAQELFAKHLANVFGIPPDLLHYDPAQARIDAIRSEYGYQPLGDDDGKD